MIDKVSTELKKTVPYYVNRIMTNGVKIDIKCNLLCELKILLLLSRVFFFR